LIDVSPVSISFGNRIIGSSSVPVPVTVSNSGAAAAILGPITVGADYVISNNSCGAALAPGASCSVSVLMRPVGFGPRPGTLSFTSNAEGSPHQVTLTGSGCRPLAPSGNRTGASGDSCSP
jgi:secreted trypsin-like serine protease